MYLSSNRTKNTNGTKNTNRTKKENTTNYYGFKSSKNAPPVNHMQGFESDPIEMVQNVKD